MIRQINTGVAMGEHIQIGLSSTSASGKTKIFLVNSTEDGSFLGEIRWFGRWRKYCFFPADSAVFEQVCMRDISDFIESETNLHRRAA